MAATKTTDRVREGAISLQYWSDGSLTINIHDAHDRIAKSLSISAVDARDLEQALAGARAKKGG